MQPLDGDAVREAFERVSRGDLGKDRAAKTFAEGFIIIAVENMAQAIIKISVQRGHDVSGYTLACFGGAGGQHACRVADALGMTEVLIHHFRCCRRGMGLADIRATRQLAIEENLGPKALSAIKREGGRLGGNAKAEVAGQGVPPQDQGDRPRPRPLRRHRHAAGGGSRLTPQNEVGLRESPQGASSASSTAPRSW